MEKKKTKIEQFLHKKLTRRDFIKYGLVGIAGITASGYLLKKLIQVPKSTIFRGGAPSQLWKWSREAYHYKKLGNNVQCQICPNKCILEENDRSVCRNKINKNGKLYTIAYGNPCSVHIDPIEKKPLFHFLPQSSTFSIATAGCTFRCLNCQNWQISQTEPEKTDNYDLMPEKVVGACLKYNCQSIAYTYSEPTAFYEYMYDTSKLAKQKEIKNLWITNGSINEEPLRALSKYLDAANVDLKSFKEEIYNELNSGRLKPILNTLKVLKQEKVWFEITNLIVPSWTDNFDMIKEMSEWLVNNKFSNYPLHFSRFHPQHKLTHLPSTSISTLEKARKLALDAGMKYVYIGNVPSHEAEHTYCPKCSKIVIKRKGYEIIENYLDNGNCKFCGEKISGVWKL